MKAELWHTLLIHAVVVIILVVGVILLLGHRSVRWLDDETSGGPLDEVIDTLIDGMSYEDRELFKAEPEDHPGATYHSTTGMAMRNDLGLWRHDTELTRWFCSHNIYHGDDRSSAIFKALWCRLNDKPFDLAAEEEKFRLHWAMLGRNPDGSPL